MYVYVCMYVIITLKDEEVMKVRWTGRWTVKILKKERVRVKHDINSGLIFDTIKKSTWKGLILLNRSCTISMMWLNSTICGKRLDKRLVSMAYQKPEVLKLTKNILHNDHSQISMSGQKSILYDIQPLPAPLRWKRRQQRGWKERSNMGVCLIFLLVSFSFFIYFLN